jgi:hypothetical protein
MHTACKDVALNKRHTDERWALMGDLRALEFYSGVGGNLWLLWLELGRWGTCSSA